MEIGANDVLVPIMYGIASAMGGPQVFEALLPMLEGDFRQMDASSFAALRENLDSLNITAQQRKALLKLLDSGMPPRDVAQNLGVSVPTLYRWLPASASARA